MAKIYGQLEKSQIENLGSDPSGVGLSKGRFWFRTDLSSFKFYNGSAAKTLLTSGDVVDADIGSGAAIAANKLAAVSASKVVVSDSSGFITAGGATSAEVAFLSGVTSNIQTQLSALGFVTVSAKSADYTVTTSDGIGTILVTTASTNRTITLPASASSSNRILKIKKVDSGTGTVIIDANASETIDGALTQTIYLQYDELTIQCDGSAWYIISFSQYEEGTFTANFNTGMNTSTNNVSVVYRRVGRIVTLEVPELLVTAGATTNTWSTATSTIPSKLCPSGSNEVVTMVPIVNNNATITSEAGYLGIRFSGSLRIDRNNNWSSTTTNCGFRRFAATYTLN